MASVATTDIAPPPPKVPAPKDPKPPLESRIEGERAVAPNSNQYPRLKRAMKLAQDLDVVPSFERIRVLESTVNAAEEARAEFVEGSSRPTKRVRLTPKTIDWASAVSEEEREQNAQLEDTISLGLSDDEDGRDEDVDDDILKSIGYYDQGYVVSDPTLEYHTNSPLLATTSRWIERDVNNTYITLYDELNIAANLCEHQREYNECRKCKGKDKMEAFSPEPSQKLGSWMLNSGASHHFVGDKSILMNQRKLKKSFFVQTANGIVQVDTMGDCEFQYREPSSGKLLGFVLHDVVYMPSHERDLSLISLG